MSVIRVLIIEENLEDAEFLRDALEEAAEYPAAGEWLTTETSHFTTLEDAVTVAAAGGCDVVLMNPFITGSAPHAAFMSIHAAVHEIPVVLVIPRQEERLGRSLLRDGAQDFLIREEIDCEPLARALGNAIDRQRFFNASQSGSTFEPVTSLYNERGFHLAATREIQLASQTGQPVLLLLAEIDNLDEITEAYGRQQRDLVILEAAEIIRAAAGQTALLACLDERRFAAMVWRRRPDDLIGAIQTELAREPRPFAFSFGWSITHPGAAESIDPILTAAEASLCENMESSPFLAPLHLTPRTASATASRV